MNSSISSPLTSCRSPLLILTLDTPYEERIASDTAGMTNIALCCASTTNLGNGIHQACGQHIQAKKKLRTDGQPLLLKPGTRCLWNH